MAPTFEGLSLIRDPSDYGLSGLGLRLVLYAIGERERERERDIKLNNIYAIFGINRSSMKIN